MSISLHLEVLRANSFPQAPNHLPSDCGHHGHAHRIACDPPRLAVGNMVVYESVLFTVGIPLAPFGGNAEMANIQASYTAISTPHALPFSAFIPYTSRFAYFAWSSMNCRRGGTSSPISMLKMRSASAALVMVTCRSSRVSGFMVVSQSCSSFISPSPL